MLKSLALENFTVFRKEHLVFGQNLNVIVGENGAGKTHLLKAAYSAIAVLAESRGGFGEGAYGVGAYGQTPPGKSRLQTALADKLMGVFRPDALGGLVRRAQGRLKCELKFRFDKEALGVDFGFSRMATREVSISKTPTETVRERPVYLPTRELLTISPGFVSLYETMHLPFEETWRDTCILLGAPLARGPREVRIRELLLPLQTSMGGTVVLDRSGRFYLNKEVGGNLEMHLVAEGMRKLATVARLIATGSLLDKGYLFWDEPESNLNPRIMKAVAKTILQVAKNGIQVFVATHSLFLLRELHVLHKREFAKLDVRYIGLHVGEGDEAVRVQQGKTIDEIGSIAALDEDLEQSDRYMEVEMGPGTEAE